MGVIMQAFYWDCPRLENREYRWWSHLNDKVPSLQTAGFTALWLPPASKGANLGGQSMGYDPYDYYDLGEIDQKGTTRSWFGSKQELLDLIGAAHAHGMQVYADVVFNHNSGADGKELNLIDNTERWTKFSPESGKFPRDYKCFHPSPYESWDGGTFAGMPDLCHRNPYVYTQMIEYARWMIEDVDSLRNLAAGGVLCKDRPVEAVTFVENHDVVRDNPIVNDKMLAYAYVLTHEGYPCVFWQYYYGWNLGQEDNRSGIAALVKIHETHAGGSAALLHCDDDLYVMQRIGHGDQNGLVLAINNRGDAWSGAVVRTRWPNTRFVPGAWRGRDDAGLPDDKWTDSGGWADFWVPPRGYAVYLPEIR